MKNINEIRSDFPLLQKKINGKPIIYLDSTATALKPMIVIDAMNGYYQKYTANVFRGIYKISEEATKRYEESRKKVANFISAKSPAEVIFTRNASESINLVYYSWALNNCGKGDEVVTTCLEHHSNFIPWQELQQSKGINLKIWNINRNGYLNIDDLSRLITRRTKLLAMTSASNVLGTLVDINKVSAIVKKNNPSCKILIDAAQTVPHLPVDVDKWGVDFVAFSGHKMMSPTGIGVLWGRTEILEGMPPFQFGGDMIKEVHRDKTIYADIPHRFEAGTPHIAGVIGLGAAVDYLQSIGMSQVRAHEQMITEYAIKELSRIKDLKIYGPIKAEDKGGVVAFTMSGIHPHDVAQILDEDNVCVRVGFHCAQPLHEYIGCGPTVRASFYIYTTKGDIDALVAGLLKVQKLFK